jgi:hypothetical protein
MMNKKAASRIIGISGLIKASYLMRRNMWWTKAT